MNLNHGAARVSGIAELTEPVVDVRDIVPRDRHTIVFQSFDRLAPGCSMEVIAEHDPRPLRYLFDVRHGARCEWSYLERGPHRWRVRLRRKALHA
jgi:uncharacterized protein (DUF2249 family)